MVAGSGTAMAPVYKWSTWTKFADPLVAVNVTDAMGVSLVYPRKPSVVVLIRLHTAITSNDGDGAGNKGAIHVRVREDAADGGDGIAGEAKRDRRIIYT